MILLFFKILINLPLYYVFQAPPSLWDFFQLSSTCHVHLKIGTCSLYIMFINNSTSTPRGIPKNPYNLRLNQKRRLSRQAQKNEN